MTPSKLIESEAWGMDDDCVIVLRDSVIQLVAECADADLLDLLMKLLLEFAAQG